MNRFWEKVLCLAMGISLILGACACAGAPTEGGENRYLELVDSPSTTLNNVWYNTGGIFRTAVFDSLLSVDADMQTIKPALAKNYTRAEDGCSFTFQLNEDAVWHDGEPVDAEDVIFSFKALLRSGEVNGLLSSMFSYILGAEEYIAGTTEEIAGIKADDSVITINISKPVGNFLTAIAQFAILPEHILGEVEPTALQENDYWKCPIGCGAYEITEAVANEYFILERNENYYGETPGVEKIRLRLAVSDPVQEMKDGTLDFYVTNDPEEIAELKGIEGASDHRLNILFPAYLLVNMSDDEGVNEQLKDVRVRKALLMAIDRETIVEAVFPGSAVTDTMVPAWDSMYLTEGQSYAFNPEEAKRLLEEAGFDFSCTIRLRYSTKGQSTADLMNAIAVYWRAIGIDVDLEKFDGSGSEHMFEIRDFDICYKRLSAFEHASIYEEIQGGSVMQTSLYNQPVYDELLARLQMTDDEGSRREIIKELQKLDQDYLLRLPLFALANVAYVNEENFNMPEAYGNLWYRYDLRFEEWRLK